jgi:hypothetical protein
MDGQLPVKGSRAAPLAIGSTLPSQGLSPAQPLWGVPLLRVGRSRIAFVVRKGKLLFCLLDNPPFGRGRTMVTLRFATVG